MNREPYCGYSGAAPPNPSATLPSVKPPSPTRSGAIGSTHTDTLSQSVTIPAGCHATIGYRVVKTAYDLVTSRR